MLMVLVHSSIRRISLTTAKTDIPLTITNPSQMTVVEGAQIDGKLATPDTLSGLQARVLAGGVLALPPGKIIGTIELGVSCTLSGSKSGATILDAMGLPVAKDQGILVASVPGVTISRLVLANALIPETAGGNAAGVYAGPGATVKLADVEIFNCQDGVRTFRSEVEIDGGYIHDNGSGTGQTHNIYVGGRPTGFFRLTNLTTASCKGGHEVKSRAMHTISFGCHHTTGGEGAAYDISDGGQVSISNGSITLPREAANQNFIAYAMESTRNSSVGNIVTITNEIFRDRTETGGLILSGDPSATLVLSGCTYTARLPPRLKGWGNVSGKLTRQ
jgi:hypothetical protein